MTGESVLVTRGGRSGAFVGGDGEGDPGTGGIFVLELMHLPIQAMVAQVLVEYAEQGFSVLVVDDGDSETGEILYRIAHMSGLRDPADLVPGKCPIPITLCSNPKDAWRLMEGVDVGDFQYVGGHSIGYHPVCNQPDEHACDMGDATGTLLLMTYPNEGSRLLSVREHEIELSHNGRFVNKI